MPAGDEDYDGVPYADMVFDRVDWSETPAEHLPWVRSRRKSGERDVFEEWITEAVNDPARVVGSAGSDTGETVRIIGFSTSADEVVTVVVGPKDHPPRDDWWGASAWLASTKQKRMYKEAR